MSAYIRHVFLHPRTFLHFLVPLPLSPPLSPQRCTGRRPAAAGLGRLWSGCQLGSRWCGVPCWPPSAHTRWSRAPAMHRRLHPWCGCAVARRWQPARLGRARAERERHVTRPFRAIATHRRRHPVVRPCGGALPQQWLGRLRAERERNATRPDALHAALSPLLPARSLRTSLNKEIEQLNHSCIINIKATMLVRLEQVSKGPAVRRRRAEGRWENQRWIVVIGRKK
jgi:hypothetical protein